MCLKIHAHTETEFEASTTKHHVNLSLIKEVTYNAAIDDEVNRMEK